MIPNLPGFTLHDPRAASFKKPHYFDVRDGLMATKPIPVDTVHKQLAEHSQRIAVRSMASTSPQETFKTNNSNKVVKEHPVLRFFAYFIENVPESSEEKARIRFVRILVYVEDDTILIEENHSRNSGIQQGVLLRRMRVQNPKSEKIGDMYSNKDFKVGISLVISGIEYRIYTCDHTTEKYFYENGMDIGEFEDPPDDLYSIKRRLTEKPIRVTHIDTDKANLKKFLELDGKTLRFYAVWDDRKSLFGEKRKFTLHYFLVDGTIEIRQVLTPNSGRGNISQFLKKAKLTKPDSTSPYTDADLSIGQTVNAFGREFLLYDADAFTKEYIDQKYGPHNWTPINVDDTQQSNSVSRVPPPFNGWGDEEDSLGYVNSLHPKPPRKDLVKMMDKDGQVLRFVGNFSDPEPQDIHRSFIVSYFLADDTISVFEKQQRNSGFNGGKFIQRTKLKNNQTGQYFKPADFQVGKNIIINGFSFNLTDADSFTYSYMESNPDEFPQADLFGIILKIRDNRDLVEKFRASFETLDPELSGYVHPNEAKKSISSLVKIPEHEIMTIIRRWDDDYGFDYFGFMSSFA